MSPLSLLLAIAPVATPAVDCSALHREHLASDLDLTYEAFDQTEGSGFRVLAAAGCPRQAADLIEAYIAHNDASESSLRWHVAQLRASSGDAPAAVRAARTTLVSAEDDAASPFRWNDYVLATIAFLERDRVALQRHRDAVAAGAGAHAGNAMNLRLLDALLRHFELGYDEATRRIER